MGRVFAGSAAGGAGQGRNSTFLAPTNTSIPALSCRLPRSSGSSSRSEAYRSTCLAASANAASICAGFAPVWTYFSSRSQE